MSTHSHPNEAALTLTITVPAQDYLKTLLTKQDDDVSGIRLFIHQPGTPKAETCIAYCRKKDEKDDDLLIDYGDLSARFDRRSLPFLTDACIDYATDKMGGQLTIKAPNAKLPQVHKDSPLQDRINYVLYNEINPALAAHGGEITLVECVEEEQGIVAILRFGGGCQGCGMADVTLKEGVEKSLLQQIPELIGIRDATDHSDRSQAYFT